jgi:hypothetical protein
MATTDVGQGIVSGAMTRSEFGEQDTSESYFENNIERLNMRFVNLRVDFQNFAGSTLIWGNPTFGIWNQFYWGNTANTSFILGNTEAGVLGFNKLGTNESVPVRTREDYMWMDYTEEFSSTTFQDGFNTTASGWGTGSLFFGGSALAPYDMNVGSYTPTIVLSAGSITLT